MASKFCGFIFGWRKPLSSLAICAMGCAVTGLMVPVKAYARAEQKALELAGTQGYVYVDLPKGKGTLEVKAVVDGKKYKLLPRTEQGSTAYGLWLPPGDYKLSQWDSYAWSDYPGFKVEAGRITDLGSLVPIAVGGYQLVVLPVRPWENAHDIDSTIHEYAALLASTDPIVWSPAGLPNAIQLDQGSSGMGAIADLLMAYDRKVNKPAINVQLKGATTTEEFMRLVRTITRPIYVNPGMDDRGNLYFGADFGTVRIRHADGSWGNVSIDTLHSISAVAYVEGALVTGADNGILRSSNDGGTTWRELKSFANDVAVIGLAHESGSWVVATAHAGANGVDRLTVYVARDGGLDALEKSRDFTMDPKKLRGWLGAIPQLVHGQYYINTFNELQRLDLATLQWKAVTPPTTISSRPCRSNIRCHFGLMEQGRLHEGVCFGQWGRELEENQTTSLHNL